MILRQLFHYILIFVVISSAFARSAVAEGQPSKIAKGVDADASPIWRQLQDGFRYSVRILGYGTLQNVADSPQNPENAFLTLPRSMADVDIRPDMVLNAGPISLSVKPRMNLNWIDCTEEVNSGNDAFEEDGYINEWLARVSVTDTLYGSYGRENLQWGPSYSVSPSNPFFPDNGRGNPKKEIPGMDFFRLVWMPEMKWTFSLIVNTKRGRQEFQAREFAQQFAFKLDYTGYSGYSGLIISHGADEKDMIGAFGGWTVTDAMLLYCDAGVYQSHTILYPVEDPDAPFEIAMRTAADDVSAWTGSAVVGGAYTFLAGPTVTFEYLYNDAGYDRHQANLYNQVKRYAADSLYSPAYEQSLITLIRTFDPGLRFLRKHYAVLQYRQNDIYNILNVNVSWMYNPEDGSGRFSAIMECYVGDHAQLFTVGSMNHGSRYSEFRTILDSYLMVGLEYTF